MVRLSVYFVWLLLQNGICFLQDPCVSNIPLPRALYRGGKCTFNEKKPVCDADLLDGWYRAQSGMNDLAIQTSPPIFLSCGTKFSYWMNGTHPNSTDGVVTRTICQTNLMSECFKNKTIKVKHCGNFYVYHLMRTDTCPEGYCFGKTEPCPPFDPCDIYEHAEAELSQGQSSSCDRCGRVDFTNWYKMNGSVDLMSVLSQSYSNCSSGKHTWIRGKPGTAINGIYNTTLCVADGNNNCSETHHVYTKQCKGFSVYKLPDVLGTTCEKLCMESKEHKTKFFTCRQRHLSDGNTATKLACNAMLLVLLLFTVMLVQRHGN